jgi:hypothetical protein
MKKTLAALMMLAALCAIPAMAATTTLTGVVTDDMCGGGKHMMTGKANAECIRACVKEGAKFAVLADGKTYILAGKSSEVSALAGKKVAVSGDLKGNTLTVISIAAVR